MTDHSHSVLQCFNTVGWVFRPVEITSLKRPAICRVGNKPYSTTPAFPRTTISQDKENQSVRNSRSSMVSDLPQLLIPPVELAKYSNLVLKVLSKVVANCKDLTVNVCKVSSALAARWQRDSSKFEKPLPRDLPSMKPFQMHIQTIIAHTAIK